MSQFNWTYLAPTGKKHHVGLFHGNRTGHVLIYCNSKIVLVDFKVRQSKSYSIFIEEELCEISIERQTDRFVYGFEINKTADTPLNRERKTEDKKHLRQGMAFLTGIAAFILILILSIQTWGNRTDTQYISKMLAASGKITSAKVFLSDSKEATYNFIANGKTYSKKIELQGNGMPLEDGDEFILKYSTEKPEYHAISLHRPTKEQIQVYHDRASNKYRQLHPSLSTAYCDCITDVAYTREGINGFAKIYLQDVSPTENPRFNSDSFNRLVRDVPFQKQVERECWEFK